MSNGLRSGARARSCMASPFVPLSVRHLWPNASPHGTCPWGYSPNILYCASAAAPRAILRSYVLRSVPGTSITVPVKGERCHRGRVVFVVAVRGRFFGFLPEDPLWSFLSPCLGRSPRHTLGAAPPRRVPCTHPCAPYRHCGCRCSGPTPEAGAGLWLLAFHSAIRVAGNGARRTSPPAKWATVASPGF